MKKILVNLVFLATVVILIVPINAQALSSAQKNVFDSGIYYFNVDSDAASCSVLSSETGSGPLYGPFFPKVSNPGDLVPRINNYIKDNVPNSPLSAFSEKFVQLGQQYDANPAMVVAMAQKETSLGTTGYGTPSGGYNITNLRPGGSFSAYGSYPEGIEASYKNLAGDLYLGPPSNFKTVDQVINRWAPPVENKTSEYVRFVKSSMHKMLDGIAEADATATDSASDMSTFASGSVNDAQCQSTDGYQSGANGYDLDKMAHFYQCDPKWGSLPYGHYPDGSPKTSICEGGCGITSMAMVVKTLAGSDETPLTLANKYGNVYHTDGTSWALWPVAAKAYGLKYKDIGVDFSKAAATIRQGGLVIMGVNKGYFTSNSHLLVLRAVDDKGNFYVADPNGPNNPRKDEDKPFSPDFLRTQGSLLNLFAFTKG